MFKHAKGNPGRKVPIADNNAVCESCDSYRHFARDCPHRKPYAVAAQNKRDTVEAENNKKQTCKLQETDKLNKEIGQLRILAAKSAGAAGSAEEDCQWTYKEDTRAAKGAVITKYYFLSSPPCVKPPKSYLLSTVAPLSCVSDTRDKIVIRKTSILHLLFHEYHIQTNMLAVKFCHVCVQNARPLRISADFGQYAQISLHLNKNGQDVNVLHFEKITP